MTESRAVRKVGRQDLVRAWVSQGQGAERGGGGDRQADSRLLVSFSDGGDMGKRKEEGDMLGSSSRGSQRSLEHVEVCVWCSGGRLGLKQRHLPSDLSHVPHFRACSCC